MYMSLMDRSQNCRASLEKVLVWSFAITPFLKICTFHTSARDRVQIGAREGKCWSSVSPIRELMLLPVIARQASQLCAFYNYGRTSRSLGVPVIVSQNRKLCDIFWSTIFAKKSQNITSKTLPCGRRCASLLRVCGNFVTKPRHNFYPLRTWERVAGQLRTLQLPRNTKSFIEIAGGWKHSTQCLSIGYWI